MGMSLKGDIPIINKLKIGMKYWKELTFLVCMFFLCGCKPQKGETLRLFTKTVYKPEYASGFHIQGADGYESTLIRICNPWQGANNVEMSYFIQRNGEKVPDNFSGQVIKANAQRIVCMSSSYVAMLDAVGKVDKIVGVSGLEYISNSYVNTHRTKIKDVGPEMNYEVLVALKPDVVLLYGIKDEQSVVTEKLRELNIPYMYIGEYLEESPLGKAEWLIVLSEITECRKSGILLFKDIVTRYNQMKERVAHVKERPGVMLNVPWNDTWIVPSLQNYMVRLITDAGGIYLYRHNNGRASVSIGMETAYVLIAKADYWLNVGSFKTLAELCSMNPRFADAKAVKNGKVYNNNLRMNSNGGNDFWESAVVCPDIVLRDMIQIFHQELIKDELYYYRQLK